MTPEELQRPKATLRDFFARATRSAVVDDQDLFAQRVLTSLLATQLVLFIEKEFRIRIEDADLELENFQSINAIAALVARKRGGA